MNKHQSRTAPSNPTTPSDASRVQSTVARVSKGAVPKGSHVGRLQRAAARNFGKSGGK